jgi:hypothetical protein
MCSLPPAKDVTVAGAQEPLPPSPGTCSR